MKKALLLLFILIIFTKNVLALETKDITDDVEIKFKWYREVVDSGTYYPKKEKLKEYLEDKSKIKYGEESDWKEEYCSYSKDNYIIEEKTINSYDKLDKIKYILIQTASGNCPSENCIDDVKIFSLKGNVDYQKIEDGLHGIKIELSEYVDPNELMFYIATKEPFAIYLSKTAKITIERIESIPGFDNFIYITSNWKANDKMYTRINNIENNEIPPLSKNIKKVKICRFKEVYTYRYKTKKEYYDNNYHTYIEGYLPEINNYKVNYNKEFPVNKVEVTKEIEVTKEVKVPQIEKEYVYIEREPENKQENEINNSIKEADKCEEKEKIVYKTEEKEKIVNKIPPIIYLLLTVLTIIIIFESIKLLKKNVD